MSDTPCTKYSMLAIDLDGTLLCSRGQVSQANREAVADARKHGLFVTICTGRGLVECKHITDQIEQADPIVVAGGSMVACPASGKTLHRFTMNDHLVRRLVSVLASHGHAVLVLKDPVHAKHDYVVVSERGEDGIDPVTRWWFAKMKVPVRYIASLDEDEHLPHTVRVGVCGPKRRTDGVASIVRDTFADEVMMQHFHAVVPRPEQDDPEGKTLILECFDKAANKWSAIQWLADSRGVHVGRVAAIGNDINDIAMLEQAALAVAMGNAIDEAKSVAHKHTLGNDEDGVAHAIEQILRGGW